MARFVATASFDYRKLDLYKGFESAEIVPDQGDPSQHFTVQPSHGAPIDFRGVGFEYLPNGDPYSGTTKAISLDFYNPLTGDYEKGYELTNLSISSGRTARYLDQTPQSVVAEVFKGTDFIYGSSEDDRINGFGGVDFLTGGFGDDTFYFTTALATKNIDHITDFDPRYDKIALSKSLFKLDHGQSISEAFHDITTGSVRVEKDTDHILYNHKSGYLYYDSDGKGGHSPVHFATIDNHSLLTGGDFLLV